MKTLGIICLLIAVLKLQTIESFSKQGVWVYGKCSSRYSCVERRDCAELAKDENDACPDSAPDSAICCQKVNYKQGSYACSEYKGECTKKCTFNRNDFAISLGRCPNALRCCKNIMCDDCEEHKQ